MHAQTRGAQAIQEPQSLASGPPVQRGPAPCGPAAACPLGARRALCSRGCRDGGSRWASTARESTDSRVPKQGLLSGARQFRAAGYTGCKCALISRPFYGGHY